MGKTIHPNSFLYVHAPTKEQFMEAVAKKHIGSSEKPTVSAFCRVYGINYGIVKNWFLFMRHGKSNDGHSQSSLPARYWKIIYDIIDYPPDNPNYAPTQKQRTEKPNNERVTQDPVLRAFL